ncbi:hypothetical protein V6N13_061164 [Hibiscus sabdariffa]
MCAENPKTNPLKSQNTSEPLSDHSRCVKKPCQSGISLSNDDAMVMDLSYSALHDKKPNSTYPNMVVTPLVLPNTNDVASNKIAEYEALPTICFECGKYGHVKDIFPSHAPEQPPTSTVNPETTPNLNDPINSNFGPWMKVERRQRHIAPKQFQPVDKPIVQGSRFIPIFETLDEDVTTSEVGPYGTPTAPVCTKKTLPH